MSHFLLTHDDVQIASDPVDAPTGPVDPEQPDGAHWPQRSAAGAAGPNAVAPDELKFAQILPLKRSGPEPLYYQLACSMEAAIAAGRITKGMRLPPEKDIARQLFLATNTVRQAWSYLEGRGVIMRTKKAGTFIA